MLYYYLLFVSGVSLLAFIAGSLGLASDIGDLITDKVWLNLLYGNAGMALVAGSIWWLHWRPLGKLWPTRGKGDQVFAKIYLWGMSFLLMLIILVFGSGLVTNLLRYVIGEGDVRQFIGDDLIAEVLRLLVAFPLWRLHWQQIKLHSGSDATPSEAEQQPA